MEEAKKIIVDSPLYTVFENNKKGEINKQEEYETLDRDIAFSEERFNLYCTKCKELRIFASDKLYPVTFIRKNPVFVKEIEDNPSLYKTYRCSANPEHKIVYGFLKLGDKLVKIAEYPSRYDSVKNDFNKYEKIIGDEKVGELAKASQLESFGYAIAAFLFYRRIYEHLILETFKNTNVEGKIPEADFMAKRMDEKVDYLKTDLPDYFVENSHLYGILSKGVHELNEDECKKYIPVARAVLYFSLDEAVDKRNAELRKQELAKQLNDISTKIK